MRTIEVVPSATALLQSLRGLGYSTETALADLIDNSIAAQASVIEIGLDWNDGTPSVVIVDDGRGMDGGGLIEAMCFGGAGPEAERDGDDLGRFGLGLKTASLSQCRRMTVVARRNGNTSALCWDIDEVERSRALDGHGSRSAAAASAIGETASQASGTGVSGTVLIRWRALRARSRSFFLRVRDIRAHLSMVFHRFISGDARRLRISRERP